MDLRGLTYCSRLTQCETSGSTHAHWVSIACVCVNDGIKDESVTDTRSFKEKVRLKNKKTCVFKLSFSRSKFFFFFGPNYFWTDLPICCLNLRTLEISLFTLFFCLSLMPFFFHLALCQRVCDLQCCHRIWGLISCHLMCSLCFLCVNFF